MSATSRMLMRLGDEIRSIVSSALEIAYFSRGAWSYNDVLMMSQAERQLAVEFIKERLKAASKSPFPVF